MQTISIELDREHSDILLNTIRMVKDVGRKIIVEREAMPDTEITDLNFVKSLTNTQEFVLQHSAWKDGRLVTPLELAEVMDHTLTAFIAISRGMLKDDVDVKTAFLMLNACRSVAETVELALPKILKAIERTLN